MDRYVVHSVEKTFQLIEILSLNPGGLSLTELTTVTGLNKTTVYRLLASLIAHGYVLKDEKTNLYYLSLKLFELGYRALNADGTVAVVQPILQTLAAAVGGTVHFVLKEGSEVIYLCKEEATHGMIHMASRTGLRNPMYCTGVGKAILAYLPEPEQEQIIRTTDFVAYTEKTLTSADALRAELARTKERGYAVDDQEHEEGVCCIAAPICNENNIAYAAMSISMPHFRFTEEKAAKCIAELLPVADKISALLRGEK